MHLAISEGEKITWFPQYRAKPEYRAPEMSLDLSPDCVLLRNSVRKGLQRLQLPESGKGINASCISRLLIPSKTSVSPVFLEQFSIDKGLFSIIFGSCGSWVMLHRMGY